MAEAAYRAAERLGRIASEETGYGVPAHKKLKNEFGSKYVWDSIRDVKTVGGSGTTRSGKCMRSPGRWASLPR
jgi:hypothetical protein